MTSEELRAKLIDFLDLTDDDIAPITAYAEARAEADAHRDGAIADLIEFADTFPLGEIQIDGAPVRVSFDTRSILHP